MKDAVEMAVLSHIRHPGIVSVYRCVLCVLCAVCLCGGVVGLGNRGSGKSSAKCGEAARMVAVAAGVSSSLDLRV